MGYKITSSNSSPSSSSVIQFAPPPRTAISTNPPHQAPTPIFHFLFELSLLLFTEITQPFNSQAIIISELHDLTVSLRFLKTQWGRGYKKHCNLNIRFKNALIYNKKLKKLPAFWCPSFFDPLIKSRLHKLHLNRRHRRRHLINNGFVRKLIIILVLLLLLLKLLILQVAVIMRKEWRGEKVFWTLKTFTELINQMSTGLNRAQDVEIPIVRHGDKRLNRDTQWLKSEIIPRRLAVTWSSAKTLFHLTRG